MKAGTWQGSAHLWANGLLHLAAALASAWLLRSRKASSFVLSAAFLALGAACLLLLRPDGVLLASLFYPIGVSLYSVALVAYPSLLAPASSPAERGRQAGWIYAIAGWCSSAMGIGMGQNLGHVPIGICRRRGCCRSPSRASHRVFGGAHAKLLSPPLSLSPLSVLIALFHRPVGRPNSRKWSAGGKSTSPKAASVAIPNMCGPILRTF